MREHVWNYAVNKKEQKKINLGYVLYFIFSSKLPLFALMTVLHTSSIL